MSPFNAYIADLDREMGKRGIGGILVGNIIVWTMAYANDIVVMAKNREALREMMTDTLKKFLRERKLELCVEKTKVIVSNRRGREKREIFRWRGGRNTRGTGILILGFHVK